MILKTSLLVIGFGFTALGCYGAFDYTMHLEGGHVTYLVLAATCVAALPSFTPYFAEQSWEQGHRIKAMLFWCLFFMCAASVIYSTRERVHAVTAGAVAERGATRGSLARAETALTEAKVEANRAAADAKAKRALPREPLSKKAAAGSWCDTACVARWDGEATAARKRVTEASTAVDKAQGKAIDDGNPPPAWLLPLCIDFGGFVLLSFGFAIPMRRQQAAVAVETKAEPQIKVKAEPVLVVQPEQPIAVKAEPVKAKVKAKRPSRKRTANVIRFPKSPMPSVTAAALRAAAALH